MIAKETVVGSFGIFYGFAEVAESGQEIWASLRAAFTPLSATSFLIFVLLSAPCFAAIGAIRREMNDARWTIFAVGYMTTFGYLVALMVFQIGTWLMTDVFTPGTGIALVLLGVLLWLLFKPSPSTAGRMKHARAGARS